MFRLLGTPFGAEGKGAFSCRSILPKHLAVGHPAFASGGLFAAEK